MTESTGFSVAAISNGCPLPTWKRWPIGWIEVQKPTWMLEWKSGRGTYHISGGANSPYIVHFYTFVDDGATEGEQVNVGPAGSIEEARQLCTRHYIRYIRGGLAA